MIQCEGHDTKKKATTECLNCKKPLCDSCMKIHLEIWDNCKSKYITKMRIGDHLRDHYD